jgi:diguanylate cyclase (GGDEF)-like protein
MTPEQPKKPKLLDRLADENGLAIVVVDDKNIEITASNNNSMCAALSSSEQFAPRCAEFCGKAFEWTAATGKSVDYECYAGLTCRAVPVHDAGKRFVTIIGRAFLHAENYRKATERAIDGDWKIFKPTEFFENVLLTGSMANLEKVEKGLEAYAVTEPDEILDLDTPIPPKPIKTVPKKELEDPVIVSGKITALIEKFNQEAAKPVPPPVPRFDSAAELSEWRSLFGSLMKLSYSKACSTVLEFLHGRYGLDSLIWLERIDDELEPAQSLGDLESKAVRVGINADNERFVDAAKRESPVEMRERRNDTSKKSRRTLNVFPVIVGGELRGAIAVEGDVEGQDLKQTISRFCQTVGPQLEILRLRGEVSERDWLARAVSRFNESLKKIDADDFWMHVTQISAELLQAERVSLLIRNEVSDTLHTRAAIGSRINLFTEKTVGDRVAKLVLEAGNPVVVSDIDIIGMKPAPSEWSYKTPSFISYPIVIGGRKIAVMNFTDKAGGDAFNDRDLELLQAIVPQIAVAIDRTVLKDKAGEFEQLSVTDSLTGLLNRRYMEKRLVEEIQRSKRHRFPMSLMMLDVDDFKSYNDSFGHPAGDIALKIVADVLKDTLRADDVASRYGGEEFSILLPQTTSTEAAAIAERIRQRIENTEFPKRQVTVSIGIAACSAVIYTPAEIVDAADHALYEAKNHGRNNVQIYDGFGGSPMNEKIH